MKMPENSVLPDCVYEYHAEHERLCHCLPIDVSLETVLLTTTRKHMMLDRRMPNVPLLTMGHTELDGGDYCLVVSFSGHYLVRGSVLMESLLDALLRRSGHSDAGLLPLHPVADAPSLPHAVVIWLSPEREAVVVDGREAFTLFPRQGRYALCKLSRP